MSTIKFDKIKLNEPMMLFWSLIPLILLIVATNYIFNSGEQVLGTSTENTLPEVVDTKIFDEIKLRNQKFKWSRKGVVSILFAGSYKNQFEIGYPLLKSNNLVAVVSAPSAEISVIPSKMSWLNLQLLQHQGWEVISQSKDQICDAEKLKDVGIVNSETVDSKSDLTKHGLYINSYVAPCGIVTSELLQKVKINYKSLINFGILYNQIPASNKYNLVARSVSNKVNIEDVKGWIKETEESGQWLILVIPEIGENEDYFSIREDYLKEVINEISQSKNQTATIGEVLKY